MKRKLKSISILVVVLLIAACTNQPAQTTEKEVKNTIQYTCPMHPQVLEEHPGICPICGMTLVKKSGHASEGAGINLQTVLQPVNSAVVSDVRAITPRFKTAADTITADGYLDFDTRTFNNIAARYSGRIEKLYIKYAFEEIHKGQRIMDVYSPEMVTAQQDFLFLVENPNTESDMFQAARQKLSLLGMTETQIDQLKKTGKIFYTLPVYSPYDGHVHDLAHSQMGRSGGNGSMSDYTQNLPLAVKEGMYVEKGQTLFNVVDPHQLWAVLKIRQADAGKIKLGQAVSVSIPDQNMVIAGRVNFIEPTLQSGDKSTSIRVYLPNHMHELKVGSLIKGQIVIVSQHSTWLPRTAVIELGRTKIVWLKRGGSYQAHEVMTGMRNATEVQIVSGLAAADSVAVNGQYLADSENFIKLKSHE